MPDFHVAFRDLLHAVNLRHGTDGFTTPPKEGVLRIFSPWKIRRFRPGSNPQPWVLKANTLPLDHRIRLKQSQSGWKFMWCISYIQLTGVGDVLSPLLFFNFLNNTFTPLARPPQKYSCDCNEIRRSKFWFVLPAFITERRYHTWRKTE
jgi:hypothetical protein